MVWKPILQVMFTIIASVVWLAMWAFVGCLAYGCFKDIWKW